MTARRDEVQVSVMVTMHRRDGYRYPESPELDLDGEARGYKTVRAAVHEAVRRLTRIGRNWPSTLPKPLLGVILKPGRG